MKPVVSSYCEECEKPFETVVYFPYPIEAFLCPICVYKLLDEASISKECSPGWKLIKATRGICSAMIAMRDEQIARVFPILTPARRLTL